jgi:hypothetical protein
MSIHKFIERNKSVIQNIDGNLDEAVITILLEDGRLSFYWFDNGKYIKHSIKE